MDINTELKKISLSIKEVKPIDPESAEEPVKESDDEKIPSEHSEEMTNTIGDIIKDSQE
jgi:small subunit ribosomal protein S1